MKQTAFIILFSLCSIVLSSQAVTSGSWTATPFQQGIIKLSWAHAAMQRNETFSNAVVLKPVLPGQKVVAGKRISWPDNQFTLTQKGNTLFLESKAVKIQVLGAFDSLHNRGIRLAMPAKTTWFGGGERATPMNRAGQRISLYNGPAYGYGEGQDQLNYSVPFIMTNGGYGLFFDNPSKGYIDFGMTIPGVLEAGFESGGLNFFLVPGNSPSEILHKYTLLTGRQPLPPLWALGNFVSRFGYRSQQQVNDVVKMMQVDSFPMDALIIDLFWFGKTIQGTLGNLDWDRDKWPEPQKMMGGLASQNIKTILITEPFVVEGTHEYKASLPYLATDTNGKPYQLTEFYFGKGGIIDLFKKSSRQWFWQFYKRQSDIGVDGWWGDLGEPEHHPAGVMHNMEDLGIKRKMSANEVHNIYGHFWSQMVYENWMKNYPGKRLFFLNRAGYAGSQRFSTFPWTGDVGRNWSGLRAQLPVLQSMSLSGIPYIHSDAGGFAMTDTADAELYTRWLQFAAFTPIFRPHGSALEDLTPDNTISLPSEPTFWGAKTKAIALQTIRNRYRLLPYNYTLAWEQANWGKPLIRPMIFENMRDSNLLVANDQYMWGSALLVAPVLQTGTTSRKLYLPPGTWYRFTDYTSLNGGCWIEEPVSISFIPVFVKGGAFVPTWEKQNIHSTEEYKVETELGLTWFPGINSDTSFVYFDDGATPGANSLETNHRLMKWVSYKNGTSIHIKGSGIGKWKPSIRTINFQIPVNGLNELLKTKQSQRYRILVNGKEYPIDNLLYTTQRSISIRLEAGINHSIEIQKIDN